MPSEKQMSRIKFLVTITLLLTILGSLLTSPRALTKSFASSRQHTPAYVAHGLNFSPFVDGQDPNQGAFVTEEQLIARMQIIASHTHWIRTFGCSRGLEKAGMIAHNMGLQAAVGAWLGPNLAANDLEIANLIAAANAGHVDMAIVGSEVLLRNDLSEAQLLAYMNQVRQQIPANVPVTTADVYGVLLEHPAVIANSDIVLSNHYPYWTGYSIEIAIATLHREYQQVVAASGGKTVLVSETGWPTAGNTINNAVPSPENAAFHWLNFVSWARANNVGYFYFSAFDETWKANYEGPQGAHWGLWTKDGILKPGMQSVFDGQTIPDNWTNPGIPGGPGTPTIELAYVPPYGSSNNLLGQVLHVNPEAHKVAVYIFVNGWWTKPTFATPLTNIALDGSWLCDITTGGSDQNATAITAFLVPNGYTPPPMSGGQTLPPELDENSIARVDIQRPSTAPFIEGRVTNASAQSVNLVTISLSGTETRSTNTHLSGNYSLLNLQPGGNYTVTPSHPGFNFNPASLTFNNLAGGQTADFVASPIPTPTPRTNVAAAVNGGLTTVSSTFSGYAGNGPAVINGDRKGVNWLGGGGWNDGTGFSFPDWLQVDFNGSKVIDEIDVFTLQDNYSNPSEPTETMIFGSYGLTGYEVQYWTGSAWANVPGGSVSGNNKVWRQFTFPSITTTKIRVLTNASADGYSRLVEVEAWGVAGPPPPPTTTNFALAANGGSTTVSSTFAGYAGNGPAVINGDRKGVNWLGGGGWNDGTASSFPDWLQVDFNGSKTIDEIDVFTLQDNYANPSEPTEAMIFGNYGLTGYEVQYWTGSAWANVPGGSVSGNNQVWRKFTFPSITTTKVRVLTNASTDGYSRLVEVEAWGIQEPSSRPNVALASKGGVTTVSSTFSGYAGNGPAVINGDRKGINWLGGGGWNDGTAASFPDWLQVDFNGSKTIDEIDVFTLQDNYANPSEPTEAMVFGTYGLTAYEVQYWTGSAWVNVPGGSVSGNNKVWRKFTFSPLATTKIRVLAHASADGYSRLVEVEAYQAP